MSGALAGLTVIEIVERVVGEATGKLIADFGAEVIKIERPGGTPTRAIGPLKDGTSAVFGYFNTNKKSVVLDLDDPADRARLDQVLARAHALIDDHDETWCEARGLSSAAIAAAHPHLVHCIITPFGQGAPREWQKAHPINVINAGGWGYHSPNEAKPDKPPLKGAGRFLPSYEAGIDAAMCVLASLHRQRRTQQGQFIDISEVEAQMNRFDSMLGRLLAGESEPSRERTACDMGGPATCFACKDGHVYLFMTTQAHWKALSAVMGDPAWVSEFEPDWLEFHCTRERVEQFRTHFRPWIAFQEKLAITEAAQKAGVAMVPINTAADLPRHEQFIHRGFFQQLEGLAYPTVPYRMSASPVLLTHPAPALGAHDGELKS